MVTGLPIMLNSQSVYKASILLDKAKNSDLGTVSRNMSSCICESCFLSTCGEGVRVKRGPEGGFGVRGESDHELWETNHRRDYKVLESRILLS